MGIARWAVVLPLLLVQSSPLIETHELAALLSASEASILLEVIAVNENRDPADEFRIPRSKFLWLKRLVDASGGVKAPPVDTFKEEMKKLGVKYDEATVVLYDRNGVRNAAVAWWLMQLFGRKNVRVLNGGLAKWVREGLETETGPSRPLSDPALEDDSLYQYAYDGEKVWTSEDVHAFESDAEAQARVQLVDVRSRIEFDQSHVPSSVNMPISILTRADDTMRSAIELRSIFENCRVATSSEMRSVLLSKDGADATAALLALRAVDKENYAFVSGGWLEYEKWTGGMPAAVEPTIEPPPASPSDSPAAPVPEPSVPMVNPPQNRVKFDEEEANNACDSLCTVACTERSNVSKVTCWDACGCPAFSLSPLSPLAVSALRSVPAPHAFLACEQTCASLCASAASLQCREECVLSSCSRPAGSEWVGVLAFCGLFALLCVFGFRRGAGSVKDELSERLLSDCPKTSS